jgi:diaminopimelate decarboxylase
MNNNNYNMPSVTADLGSTLGTSLDRNSYARGSYITPKTHIDDIELTALSKKYGSPLFVFSERQIKSKARRAKEAFETRYENVSFAWSYKTNYLSAICNIFHKEGWIAEVVSDFEYEKARKNGIPAKDIVFNGPHKPTEILIEALNDGALVQIDNWDELLRIEELTKSFKEPVSVGLRVWLDAGISPVWTKFGFAVGNGEALRAAIRIVHNSKLKLHTLHSHIGTYILDPEAYRHTCRILVALREQILMESGHLVPCLNLGGGIPSNSLLHGMLGSPEINIPSIENYAEAITDQLKKLPKSKRPLLRLELGRHLIDEAGYLLTKIIAIKAGDFPAPTDTDLSATKAKEWLSLYSDAKRSLVVDAGINLLYTAAWYQISVSPCRLIRQPPIAYRLYGSLCMAIDVIRDNVDLPPLDIGDLLVLHPVGAYNLTQSMQFIFYRPPVILIKSDGDIEIIRRKETLQDIERLEKNFTDIVSEVRHHD